MENGGGGGANDGRSPTSRAAIEALESVEVTEAETEHICPICCDHFECAECGHPDGELPLMDEFEEPDGDPPTLFDEPPSALPGAARPWNAPHDDDASEYRATHIKFAHFSPLCCRQRRVGWY